ncbi:DUF6233 domain-containing protein [Streptomyces sp. NPDC001054]
MGGRGRRRAAARWRAVGAGGRPRGGRRIVHRAGCSHGPDAEPVDEQEALRVAAYPEVGGVCSLCRPDRVRHRRGGDALIPGAEAAPSGAGGPRPKPAGVSSRFRAPQGSVWMSGTCVRVRATRERLGAGW